MLTRHLLLAGVLASGTASAAEPEVFYDVRVSSVVDQPGHVLVEASWEGACRGDDDAWSDPRMGPFLHDKLGIVAVRQDPRVDDKGMKQVGLYQSPIVPTRVLRLNGEEVDRVCGCTTPKETSYWLKHAVESGATWAETLTRTLPDPEVAYEPARRLDIGDAHVCAGRFDAAFDTYWDLWEQIPTKAPTALNLRMTRLITALGRVAKADAGAHDRLVAARDGLWAKVQEVGEAQAYEQRTNLGLMDGWIGFNRVLGDDDASFTWLVEHRDDTRFSLSVPRHRNNLIARAFELERFDALAKGFGTDALWVGPEPAEDDVVAVSRIFVAKRAAGDHDGAKDWAKAALKATGSRALACAMVEGTVSRNVAHPDDKALAGKCGDKELKVRWTNAVGG